MKLNKVNYMDLINIINTEFQINFFKKHKKMKRDEESYMCLLHELELRNIYCGKEKSKFYYVIRFLVLYSC